MLSIASSHCILTISRDFYPKIRQLLEWKISAATWNSNTLTWSGQVDLTAATLRSMLVSVWLHTMCTIKDQLIAIDGPVWTDPVSLIHRRPVAVGESPSSTSPCNARIH